MKIFAAFFAVLLASSFALSQDDALNRRFKKFTRSKIDLPEANSKARTGEVITISDGVKTFRVRLTPRYLKKYREEDERVSTFKGKVIGEPDSEVRLTVNENGLEGYVITKGGMWFIEPMKRHSPEAGDDDFIIYRAEDVTVPVELNEPLRTGVTAPATNMPTFENVLVPESYRIMEIATEADNQFVSLAGGVAAANNEILSILNMVEGIYERQLGISLTVTFQNAWGTPDPYTGTDGALLDSFLSRWNSVYPMSSHPRDVAHLFTGKVRNAGIAYVGTVCTAPNWSYGYTGRGSTVSTSSLIAAHELGHNLSAEHVENSGTCANSIMNPTINQFVTDFCPTSVNAIGAYVSANGSCLGTSSPAPTPTPAPGARKPFDFDADSRADVAVYRPSEGMWYIYGSGVGVYGQRFGIATDKPVAADYDGDGRTDAAVYRSGQWHLMRSQTGYAALNFGTATDIPQPADYDGDGKAEVGVFRPSTGTWYMQNVATGQTSGVTFGLPGDKPLAGDYDGDGRADPAVFRPSNRTWYILGSQNGFMAVAFGLSTDKLVPADFDGDGRTDIATYRAGVWYIQRSSQGFAAFSFGLATDVPVPADYDGDGKAEAAVFRPSDGTWHIYGTSSGYSVTRFGIATDIPAPAFRTQ